MADNSFQTPLFQNFPGEAKTNRFSSAFPDPYLDYASTQMPRSIYDVLKWCEYLWLTNGTYRMAVQRVVRYFLTSIELTDASEEEKEKYDKFLNDDLKVMEVLALSGDNLMAYGNDFISFRVPIRRYLSCKKCFIEIPITRVDYEFKDKKFIATCPNPKCRCKGEMSRIDRRSQDKDKIKIIHWSPHEIKLLYDPVNNETVYLWEIPAWYVNEIKKGNKFYLENTPWEIVECIFDDKAEKKLFKFNEDYIYHLREECISGVRHFGWGIPRVMGNFKQAWYIQVLKRYNEAIALDYIIPFRVITPALTSGQVDPLTSTNMGSFNARVMNMFRQHRKDPTSLHALPFPIDMKLLGADGKALAPSDLLDKGIAEFLNAQGVPAEMFQGTLQLQAMPVALRLFERTWVHLVGSMNGLLNWMFKRISELQNWENLRGRLQPVTLADDMEKKQIQLQLAAGSKISNATALAPFGINAKAEVKRKLEEMAYEQEQQMEFQERTQHKQELQSTVAAGSTGQPGAPGQPPAPQQGQPQGGMPPQGGGDPNAPQQPMQSSPSQQMSQGMGGNITPDDMMQQAEQFAIQIAAMPYEPRRSELLKIKKANETMHALIISKLGKLRQQARSVGGYQALQQMVGGSGGQ